MSDSLSMVMSRAWKEKSLVAAAAFRSMCTEPVYEGFEASRTRRMDSKVGTIFFSRRVSGGAVWASSGTRTKAKPRAVWRAREDFQYGRSKVFSVRRGIPAGWRLEWPPYPAPRAG